MTHLLADLRPHLAIHLTARLQLRYGCGESLLAASAGGGQP